MFAFECSRQKKHPSASQRIPPSKLPRRRADGPVLLRQRELRDVSPDWRSMEQSNALGAEVSRVSILTRTSEVPRKRGDRLLNFTRDGDTVGISTKPEREKVGLALVWVWGTRRPRRACADDAHGTIPRSPNDHATSVPHKSRDRKWIFLVAEGGALSELEKREK